MNRKKEPTENPENIELREALKDAEDARLRIALRGRGIDPYELSQKDFDELRRLINMMRQIDSATQARMTAVQQEGMAKQQEISQKLEELFRKVFAEQHGMTLPPQRGAEGVPGQPAVQDGTQQAGG